METQILTPEIYGDINQEKVIPIVSERDDNGTAYIPVLFKNRKYIDLSNEETFEREYEMLLRNLYDRPLHRKPKLGKEPSFLFEEEPDHYATKNLLKKMKKSAESNPRRIIYQAEDFIGNLIESIEKSVIIELVEPHDEQIYDSISDLKFLRNDYINFLEEMVRLDDSFDIDIIIEMFERIDVHTLHKTEMKSSFSYQFDNIKFFIWEIFVYTVAILLKFNKYDELGILLSNSYFLESDRVNELSKFTAFRPYLESIERDRKNRLSINKLSLTAQMFIDRCDSTKYKKEDLIEADILLNYLSYIYDEQSTNQNWFPLTYVYLRNYKFLILKKLISKRHAEKIKGLFSCDTIEDLKIAISKVEYDERMRYRNSFESIPNINRFIKVHDIGIER